MQILIHFRNRGMQKIIQFSINESRSSSSRMLHSLDQSIGGSLSLSKESRKYGIEIKTLCARSFSSDFIDDVF